MCQLLAYLSELLFHSCTWFPDSSQVRSHHCGSSTHTESWESAPHVFNADVRSSSTHFHIPTLAQRRCTRSRTHHITFISTGGKFSPLAQSQHVMAEQVNRKHTETEENKATSMRPAPGFLSICPPFWWLSAAPLLIFFWILSCSRKGGKSCIST